MGEPPMEEEPPIGEPPMDAPLVDDSPVAAPPADEPPIEVGGIDEDVPPDAPIAFRSPAVIVELTPEAAEPPEPFTATFI